MNNIKSKVVIVHCEDNEKGLWNAQALLEGVKLSEWLRNLANNAISDEIKDKYKNAKKSTSSPTT